MARQFKIEKYNNGSISNATKVTCNSFNNIAGNNLSADTDFPFLSKSDSAITVISEIQEVTDGTTIEYDSSTGILKAENFVEGDLAEDPRWHVVWNPSTGEFVNYYIGDISINNVINSGATKIRVTYAFYDSFHGDDQPSEYSPVEIYVGGHYDVEEYAGDSWYGSLYFTLETSGTDLLVTDVSGEEGDAGHLYARILKIENYW